MPQSFTIIDEDRNKRYQTVFVADDLKLVKTVAAAGYYFVAEYPQSVPAAETTTKHIYTKGSVIDPAGVVAPRGAGSMSTDLESVVPAGQHRRECPEPSEFWCIMKNGNPNGNVNHVNVQRLDPDQTGIINPGKSLFVLYGDCAIGTKILERDKLYRVASAPKTLTASTKAFVVVWTPIL